MSGPKGWTFRLSPRQVGHYVASKWNVLLGNGFCIGQKPVGCRQNDGLYLLRTALEL